MELKLNESVAGKTGDEMIQRMLGDILVGLRTKLVQPVMEGNFKIAGRLEELEVQNRTRVLEIMARLETLESEVQRLPLVILAALRDAINQAGGNQNES